ncbi:MAG: hypothetical protein IKZ53_06385 [Selenomonadaceae bacterium]|nr:hypothetical protein [Selenomonadaceae bacterium]
MISIDKSVLKLLNDAPSNSICKIFLFIALNQPDDGIRGFRYTKDDLISDLHSSKTSVFRDLKWLKDNLLIQELKLAEDFDFMANPRFVMNNSDYQERFAEWNRRCNLDSEREVRLRRKKRILKLRSEKK